MFVNLHLTMKAPVIADLIKNKVLQKVKDSPLIIAFPNLGSTENVITMGL